jgi:hypothetical protein
MPIRDILDRGPFEPSGGPGPERHRRLRPRDNAPFRGKSACRTNSCLDRPGRNVALTSSHSRRYRDRW